MKTKHKSLFITQLLFLIIALFLFNVINKQIMTFIIVGYYIVIKNVFKINKKRNINDKQLLIVMIVFGLLYVMLFYMMGFYFGFYKATVKFSWWGIMHYILPISLIIISSEKTKSIIVQYKSMPNKIILYITMVIIDYYIYKGAYSANELDDFLTIIGHIVMPAILSNLFYLYYDSKYKETGVIAYRLITSLFFYIIPIIPDVYMFFRSFLKMLSTFLIYYYINTTYSNKIVYEKKQRRTISTITTIILVSLMACLVMLVSCKFKYGVMVIATGSMSGTFEKGDVVLYETYKKQNIQKDDIILFKNENIITVHRVIAIKSVSGNYQYYTKGDANQNRDDGYAVKEDIRGIYKFHIKYIGYPTLWINDIFNK